jgi:hypothetical protein
MNQLFNFAFLNFLLARLPQALLKEVNDVTNGPGFEALLCAIAQSPEAQKHFRRMLESAVLEVKHRSFTLNATRVTIMGHLKPGARVEPR